MAGRTIAPPRGHRVPSRRRPRAEGHGDERAARPPVRSRVQPSDALLRRLSLSV